ncbi:NAD(P)-dependent oxidoreductase [Lacticaseibacillus nasuensis]|uniref:3-hydroxyisobutyrate dehydrogenase n=1 Tax=Lacticaseibacillus nasuensis JCM 17158 TaxID=1291734 RepID=A0A0R1JZ86_9LACO|nr:NAD(P)-dependent oxidoreductase [Lacticaseibacillus nasuensis]KRK74057.1 3-hydroxyisobutyrate dehydrogenase [Lacticaseibacillus nasuensis JCM 17158]
MKIGFIGTGVMGTGIILNLLKAGYAVTVYNRTKAHAATVLAAGATWADSPQAVAAASDVTLSMVGFPADVEQVYFGETGILAGAKPHSIVVDMTTSTPTLAQTIATKAAAQSVQALDAPVSGGDVGAKAGTLSVMVGGPATALAQVQPIFNVIASHVTRFGDAGSGQHAKMANQIMIAGTMTGLTEMLVYAKAAGLDLTQVIATVSGGAGDNWSMRNYGPRILAADYTPGFFVKHFVKDLKIALAEAQRMHLDLPATAEAARLYEALQAAGDGDLGTQGLITSYPSWQ